jgi:RND family efflux transporter MFP subunit
MRRDLSESLRVVGSLAPNETATIRPEMSGLIRSIHFEEGRQVKKGDLLVKIDDSELKAQLAQTQSRHELAKLNLERAENLRSTQSNTQADADRARSEFAATQAELESFFEHLARFLDAIDFHKGKAPDMVTQRLRRLFLRAQPDPRELRILRGILSDAQRQLR